MKIRVISSTLFLLAFLYPHNCLQGQIKSSAANKTAADRKAKDDAAKARRDEAISLLMSLAAEAQGADAKSRSHLQAQAAYLLWKVDEVYARELFLKAWTAAEIADRKEAEDQTAAASKVTNHISPRDARREVIFLALQNDRRLGEELLARISKENATAVDKRSDLAATQAEGNDLSPDELDRLSLARELLETGNTNQAAQFAGEALSKVAIPTLRFLAELRERNQPAADEIYLSLLTRAQADPGANANMVSLLSSYVFSPDLYVRIGNNGFPTMVQITRTTHPVDVAPNIRLAFLNTAIQILLGPTLDPAAERASFMIGTRLLPLFDQFNPSMANQLRTRLIQLSPAISPALKTVESANRIRTGIGSTDSQENNVDELLNQAEGLTDSSASDHLLVRAATIAAEHGDKRAEKIAQRIRSDQLRQQVSEYIVMVLAKFALNNKQIDRALELARSAELNAIERVWIYIQVTNQIGTKRKPEAADTLFEVLPAARQMELGPEKARVMIGIAVQLIKFKSELAKGYVADAVTITNKLDNFSGEDTGFNVCIESSRGAWQANYSSPAFSLTALFRELATDDFFQAINTADTLKDKQLKSEAILTIARSALLGGTEANTAAQR